MAVKVDLSVNDGSFNAKLRQAVSSFKTFVAGIKGAKTAQEALNNAIKACPMGLITTAATVAGEALVKYVAGVYDAEKAQADLATEIENTISQLDTMKSESDFHIAIAKAAGASRKELYNMRMEAAQAAASLASIAYFDAAAKAPSHRPDNFEEIKNAYLKAQQRVDDLLKEGLVDWTAEKYKTGPYKEKKKKTTKPKKEEDQYAEDSITAQEKLVDELTKKWKNAAAAVKDDYAKQLDEAKYKLDVMTGKETFAPSKLAPIVDKTGRTPMADIAPKEGLTIPVKLEIESPYQKLTAEIQRLKGEMHGVFDPAEVQAYNERIAELQKQLGTYEGKVKEGGEASQQAYSRAAQGINLIGSALNNIEDPGAKIMATIGQAIATIALSYAETLAKDKTNKSNIWLFIASAAAAMVSMVSTISQIHSATGYAQGGIVKGNSYSGDNMMAQGPGGELVGLNAGEVVLTRAMASNLANSLQSPMSMMRIVGEVQGERIVLVANRFLKRSGQGEIVTW